MPVGLATPRAAVDGLPGPGPAGAGAPAGAGTPALFLNARGGRLSRQSAWTVLRGGGRAGRR